jgi:hypothetical protein
MCNLGIVRVRTLCGVLFLGFQNAAVRHWIPQRNGDLPTGFYFEESIPPIAIAQITAYFNSELLLGAAIERRAV